MNNDSLLAAPSKIFKRIDLLFVFALYFFSFHYFAQERAAGFYFIASLFVKALVVSYAIAGLLAGTAGASGKSLVKSCFWPFVGIELVLRMAVIVIMILITLVLGSALPAIQDQVVHYCLVRIVGSAVLAIQFFWFAAHAGGARGFITSLHQAWVTARKHPLLFLWCFYILTASSFTMDTVSGAGLVPSAGFTVLSSLLYALLILDAYARTLGAIREDIGPAVTTAAGTQAKTPESEEQTDNRLATTAFVCGLASFIPLVHFAALALGLKIFAKQKTGRIRSLLGLLLGGFFSALYLILLVGLLTAPKKVELTNARTLQEAALSGEGTSSFQSALKSLQEHQPYAAIEILEKQAEPNTPARAFALGIAYEQAGDGDKAIARFKECISFPGHNGEAYYHLGVLTIQTNKKSEASDYFDKFLQQFPGEPNALVYQRLMEESVPHENNIPLKILQIMLLLFCFTIHEFAHALAAFRCGDDTQESSKRLSLNPLRHIDPFGSVILPGLLILKGSNIVFGWAKPVVVDRSRLRSPDKDDSFISAVGPLANLAAAMAATVLLLALGLVLTRVSPDIKTLNFLQPFMDTSVVGLPIGRFLATTAVVLKELIVLSLVLAVFNLLPIPPLDGSWILENTLPASWRPRLATLRKYSLLLLLVLIFTHALDWILLIPLQLYLGFALGFIGGGIGLM